MVELVYYENAPACDVVAEEFNKHAFELLNNLCNKLEVKLIKK